jgi:hypothetical protein
MNDQFLLCFLISSTYDLQTARLFGPAVFEASKLRVLFLGSNKEHPDRLPRIYTLTHSDVTSKITLAVSREINKAQVGKILLSSIWHVSIATLRSSDSYHSVCYFVC